MNLNTKLKIATWIAGPVTGGLVAGIKIGCDVCESKYSWPMWLVYVSVFTGTTAVVSLLTWWREHLSENSASIALGKTVLGQTALAIADLLMEKKESYCSDEAQQLSAGSQIDTLPEGKPEILGKELNAVVDYVKVGFDESLKANGYVTSKGSGVRVALLLPRSVGGSATDPDHVGRQALHFVAMTDKSSISYNKDRYFLRGEGVAGNVWKKAAPIAGRLDERKKFKEIKKFWKDMREDGEQEHEIGEIVCLPVMDPHNKKVLLGVMCIDHQRKGTVVLTENEGHAKRQLQGALSLATQSVAIIVRTYLCKGAGGAAAETGDASRREGK